MNEVEVEVLIDPEKASRFMLASNALRVLS